MELDTNLFLATCAAFTLGIYLSLLFSSFRHNRLNGFKASILFATIFLALVFFIRMTEEQIVPMFYAQILVYLTFCLNAYTFYRAMECPEPKAPSSP